jgi:hypothetical protein
MLRLQSNSQTWVEVLVQMCSRLTSTKIMQQGWHSHNSADVLGAQVSKTMICLSRPLMQLEGLKRTPSCDVPLAALAV